jgi:hypothetical protein
MTQRDLDRAVATVTGETVSEIHHLGFSLADPLDVRFDPEPRRPLVFDWDSMTAAEWPG